MSWIPGCDETHQSLMSQLPTPGEALCVVIRRSAIVT